MSETHVRESRFLDVEKGSACRGKSYASEGFSRSIVC